MKLTHLRNARARILKKCLGPSERCVQRMKPFLLFFKLCGIFANEITKRRLKRCSWPFYGICVCWIGVYATFTCVLIYTLTKVRIINVRLIIDVVKHLTAYCNLSINVISTYYSQDSFIKFFDRLESYDDEVARLKRGRRDNLWIAWTATFFMITINLFLASVMMFERSTGILYFVTLSDICMSIMHVCGTVEKFIMLHLLLERFRHLNEKIVPKVSWDDKRPGAIEMSDVRTLHSMLYDAHEAFNDIYRNPMLIWFGSLLLHIVANIHILRERWLLIASAFFLPQILQALTLCATCHYTAEEANKIVTVLIEGMCALVDSEQTTTKSGVIIYFLHNRVSFDAAGFFTIDLPLFDSIVGTITTYLIILI